MSIGSSPEIGTVFSRWGDMGEWDRQAWFRHVETVWGPDLTGGYATVVYPDQLLLEVVPF